MELARGRRALNHQKNAMWSQELHRGDHYIASLKFEPSLRSALVLKHEERESPNIHREVRHNLMIHKGILGIADCDLKDKQMCFDNALRILAE